MKHLTVKNALLMVFMIAVAYGLTSCRKNGPAEALVTVTDSLGRAVQGALVELSQDSVISPNTGVQANVNQTQTTDLNGQTFFSFELEAVLNVKISKGAKTIQDYIRLEQSKQVDKTFVLK